MIGRRVAATGALLAAAVLAACSTTPVSAPASPADAAVPSTTVSAASSSSPEPTVSPSPSATADDTTAQDDGRRKVIVVPPPRANKGAPNSPQDTPVEAFPWGNLPREEITLLAKDYEIINAGPAGTPFGWALCEAPITYSVDSRTVPARKRAAAAADVDWALKWWGQVSGLNFTRIEDVPTSVDKDTSVITPDDGVDRPRHIYIRFTPDKDVRSLAGNVVGLGGPTRLNMNTRELVGGGLNLSTPYAATASLTERRALILHELGHVLGLDHSKDPRNIMYPIVSGNDWLGPGDIIGAAVLDRPCTTGAPETREDEALARLHPLPLPYNEFNR